jgi:glycosyltransferase involved in cell wall biosynthesis
MQQYTFERPRPSVSIGLPVYNGDEFLEESLRSLLAQTFVDFELIISDNASTDRTEEICRRFAASDPHIRYVRQAENLGAVRNFEFVLRESRGEYFAWAAHDDVWEPEFLEELTSLLDQTQAAIAFCVFRTIGPTGGFRRLYDLTPLAISEYIPRLRAYIQHPEPLGKANVICGLIRRSALPDDMLLSPASRTEWGIDMLFVFRILTQGPLVLSPKCLFSKRQPDFSFSPAPPPSVLQIARNSFRSCYQWCDYFAGYFHAVANDRRLSRSQFISLQFLIARRLLFVCATVTFQAIVGVIHTIRRSLRRLRGAPILAPTSDNDSKEPPLRAAG